VRLSADIKWADYSSLDRMKKQLIPFACSEISNSTRIVKDESLFSSNRVEISVRCGKVAKRSSFVFLRYSRNKSRIIGACPTNKLIDLINDFDLLEEQMNQSGIGFTLSDPKVFIDNLERFSNLYKRGSLKIALLADFIGTLGFISGATAFVLVGEPNLISILAVILGLIFLMGSIILSSGNQQNYILIEQE
jgi:hypothetical protein